MATQVLIAEDEPNIVELLTFLLERAGCRTSAVFDGAKALEQLRAAPPDVLVLDLMLPGCDGYEVLKTVRGDPRLSGLRVIMLTAKGQEKDRRLAESLGVDAFITKPFSNRDLVDCVTRLGAAGARAG
ncbi:MAG: response regulator [Pseudomonadota bacterium]|nr:response regulator [Pseudomonadota bacterium]